MTTLRTLALMLLTISALTLTACGGGGGTDAFDGGSADDPALGAPTIRVINDAFGKEIDTTYFYETYTGETLVRTGNIRYDRYREYTLGDGQQYSIYVEFTDGTRSYVGVTITRDPYNDTPIQRSQPLVNPGEFAFVYIQR